MKNGLSRQELDSAIDKIKQAYIKKAEKYDSSIFDIERFNKRYMDSLKMGLPMTNFISSEMLVLQELQVRAEEKYPPRTKEGEHKPSNADKLLQQFEQQIKKYPLVDFADRADEESCRLVGMLQTLYNEWGAAIPAKNSLSPGTKAHELSQKIDARLFALLTPQKNGLTRLVNDFGMITSRLISGKSEQKKAKRDFFKEAGFFLNDLSELLHEIIKNGATDKLDLAKQAEFYTNGALEDFRIKEFKTKE